MKGKSSARTAIEGMRLGRQFNYALLPLDGCKRKIWGEELERLLMENRYSPYRPYIAAQPFMPCLAAIRDGPATRELAVIPPFIPEHGTRR